MSFDWNTFAQSIVTATTAMTTAGVTAAQQGTVLSSIGAVFSGAKTKELQISAKILQFAGNPQAENQMLNELLGDVSMPPQAAQVAVDISKNLVTPGYDLFGRVAMMENFINSGT